MLSMDSCGRAILKQFAKTLGKIADRTPHPTGKCCGKLPELLFILLLPEPMFVRVFLPLIVGALCTASVAAEIASAGDAARQAVRPKIGLVLSGGGARGFAHIGALQAFEELRIPFDAVAGTSMGAMVGGGYAAGYDAETIKQITFSVNWNQMFAPRTDRARLRWRAKEDDRKGLSSSEIGMTSDGLHFPGEVVPSQELDIFLGRVTQPVNSVNDLEKLAIPFAALATNLETGERVVLQKNVTLSQAMCASMSIPGAFAPAQYHGMMLVDGGLVDNLPVAQVRSMGADVVVAINVGTPLSSRERLTNFMGVMGQMVNLLTEQSVRASVESLTENDVYIKPDLKDFTSVDFRRSAEIIQLGYEAVMKERDRLSRYAVDEQTYRSWKEARQLSATDNPTHRIERVEVRGLKIVDPERVRDEIDIADNSKATSEEVAEAARDIWGSGDFQSVPFHFEPGPNHTEVLVFEPTEKDVGYSTLRFGGNAQTDFQSSNTFNLLLAHTWGWLNDWGAEWRSEMQIGDMKRLSTQWYQPLGPTSRWFLMPEVSYEWVPFDVYYGDDDDPIASYRNETFDVNLTLGYEISRLGRLTAQAGWMDIHTVEEVGMLDAGADAHTMYVGAGMQFDTLDNPNFPKKGWRLTADVMRTINPNIDDMDSIEDVIYSVEGYYPIRLSRYATVLLSARVERGGPTGTFNLGGVFNLSGSSYGRYSGNRANLGRLFFYYDVSRKMRELRMPLYIGASLEAGRAWDEDNAISSWNTDDSWKKAASIFVATDSWIGPLYLVAGRTFGESNAVTLYWGRLH